MAKKKKVAEKPEEKPEAAVNAPIEASRSVLKQVMRSARVNIALQNKLAAAMRYARKNGRVEDYKKLRQVKAKIGLNRAVREGLFAHVLKTEAVPASDGELFKYFLDWLKDGGAEVILEIVLQIIAALA